MLPLAADAVAAVSRTAATRTAGTSAMIFIFIFQASLSVT
jgi:hypothetical protein